MHALTSTHTPMAARCEDATRTGRPVPAPTAAATLP